jgi:hypothetical protein
MPVAYVFQLGQTGIYKVGKADSLTKRQSTPARRPSSTSARRTQLRSVSDVQPIFAATETDRGPLRLVLVLMLEHQPHRTLTNLRRIPLRCA